MTNQTLIKPEHRQCSECGEVFTTAKNYDMHRQAASNGRYCQHPSQILTGNGRQRLALNADGVWASCRARPTSTAQERIDWLMRKAEALRRRGNTVMAQELIETADLLAYLGGLSEEYKRHGHEK